MDVTKVSPATITDVDLVVSDELEALWMPISRNRTAAIEQIQNACMEYRVSKDALQQICKDLADENMGVSKYMPHINLVIHRIRKGKVKTGPYDAWVKLPSCEYCVNGWAYMAGYVNGEFVWGAHIWCNCAKGKEFPTKLGMGMREWKEAIAMQKLNPNIKIIKKESLEFMEDVSKTLTTPQAQGYLKGILKGHNAHKVAQSVIPF